MLLLLCSSCNHRHSCNLLLVLIELFLKQVNDVCFLDGTNDLLCVCEDGTALVYPFTSQNAEHELLFSTGNERYVLTSTERCLSSSHEPGKVSARIEPHPVPLFSTFTDFSRFVTWFSLGEQTVVSKVERKVGADGKATDVLALFSLATKRISHKPSHTPLTACHHRPRGVLAC